jgi:hypothetical protein
MRLQNYKCPAGRVLLRHRTVTVKTKVVFHAEHRRQTLAAVRPADHGGMKNGHPGFDLGLPLFA